MTEGTTLSREEKLTEVSALWFLKMTLVNGSEVPEMSLGAKSLQNKMAQDENNCYQLTKSKCSHK